MNERWCAGSTSSNGAGFNCVHRPAWSRRLPSGRAGIDAAGDAPGHLPVVQHAPGADPDPEQRRAIKLHWGERSPRVSAPADVMEAATGARSGTFSSAVPKDAQSSGPVCPAISNWAATAAYRKDPGLRRRAWARAAEVPIRTWLSSGMIRPRDARQPAGATWDHAIAFAYPGTLKGSFAAPASEHGRSVRSGASCIPWGYASSST